MERHLYFAPLALTPIFSREKKIAIEDENAVLGLSDLTILLGRNGSGKTTVMEAIDFIADALNDTLLNALERRAGLKAIQQRSTKLGLPFGVDQMGIIAETIIAELQESAQRQIRNQTHLPCEG
jgi:predicted ATPase